MKYLMFSGASNTGKTESVYRLTKSLVNNEKYKIIDGNLPSKSKDFQCVISKYSRKIIVHSYTDLPGCIHELCEFYSKHSDVDTIITTIRDIVDPMRNRLINELKISKDDFVFEIPLGKVKRGSNRQACTKWYLNNIEILGNKIAKSSPFNL